MRTLLVFVAVVCLFELSNASQMKRFKEHQTKHRLRFSNPEHEAKAFSNFAQTDDRIEQHNSEAAQGKHTYKLEHNKFSTLSDEERLQLTGYRKPAIFSESSNKRDAVYGKQTVTYYPLVGSAIVTIRDYYYNSPATDTQVLPAKFDWRENGWNTTARDQFQCGCCWAFSAAASLEAQYKIWKNISVVLSTQHLADCDEKNLACKGGFSIFSQDRLLRGIVAESEYPYKAESNKTCQSISSTVPRYNSTTFYQVKSDWRSVTSAIYNIGPVVISMDVGAFNSLASLSPVGSIYTQPTCNDNHSVLAIGYGTDPATGKNYLIIRNSWGANWGDKGTFKMFFPNCTIKSWVVPTVRMPK